MLWPPIRTAHRDWAIAANRTHPDSDLRDDGQRLADIVAAVVEANGTSDNPAAYGYAVARRVLPDLCRTRSGPEPTSALAGVNGRASGRQRGSR